MLKQAVLAVARGVATVFLFLYFLLDALAFRLLRPFLRWLARQPLLLALGRWVGGLGPYPTLFLVACPLVLLEPLKWIGLYVAATGRPVTGTVLLVAAEGLKVVTVERLFHMGRPKLLTIPWFAWCYRRVTGWLDRLKASAPWRMALRLGVGVRRQARRLVRRLRKLSA